MELIIDDDEGSLYRVPFGVTEDGATFGEAAPVRIEYVDASAERTVGQPAAVFASRADSRPATSTETKELPVSTLADKLRDELGLGSEATEDEILAAYEQRADSTQEQPEAETAEVETPELEPALAEKKLDLPEGAVVIDAEQLKELKRGAEAGRLAAERQRREDRDRFLDQAVAAGKFPGSRKDAYAKMYDADEQGARTLIESLEAGLVPVSEIGTSATPESAVAGADQMAYPTSGLTPRERRAIAARAAGDEVELPRVMREEV